MEPPTPQDENLKGPLIALHFRCVVGKAPPVFNDAGGIRLEVFCQEQGFKADKEFDDLDTVSLHVVAYMDASQAQEIQSMKGEGTPSRTTRSRVISHQLREQPPKCTDSSIVTPVAALRLFYSPDSSNLGKRHLGVARIGRMCVLKVFRQCGIGAAMVAEAELLARTVLHVKLVTLDAQVAAIPFYASLGYKSVSKAFEKGGMQHVVMAKEMCRESLLPSTKL